MQVAVRVYTVVIVFHLIGCLLFAGGLRVQAHPARCPSRLHARAHHASRHIYRIHTQCCPVNIILNLNSITSNLQPVCIRERIPHQSEPKEPRPIYLRISAVVAQCDGDVDAPSRQGPG